jgi:Arc/MetJ-type ribon-helix-helix transcriptional regulator
MAIAATPSERVTVTMPAKLVAGIDRYERNRYERNRSRFIAEAVRHELKRRQRQELQRSLEDPHPDSIATASLGLQSWAESLPTGDAELLDPAAGVLVRWSPGQGWQEPRA